MEGELWTDVHIYVVWSMRKSLANKTYVYSSLNIFQKAQTTITNYSIEHNNVNISTAWSVPMVVL
jgi:hypothetical protein